MDDHLMLIVENEPGVLARIAVTAQRFQANIDYLRAEPLVGTQLALVELSVERSCAKLPVLRKRLEGLIQVREVLPVPAEPVAG